MQENLHYRDSMRRFANRRELASPFSEFTGVSVVAGILLYGGSLVLSGSLAQPLLLRTSPFFRRY